MSNIRLLILLPLLLIAACDYMPKLDNVVTDRRNEYKKSEAMADLEVPPDLTTDALNDPMEIPNERVTTLSEFERRKGRQPGAGTGGVEVLEDDQWLSVQGSVADIWPELQDFWKQKGYPIELNDAELGVLETGWLETGSEGSTVFRDKFSLFTEAGDNDATVIFVSSERQERLAGASDAEWVSAGNDVETARQVVMEMNLYFYGSEAPAGISSVTTQSEPAKSSSTPAAPAAASAPRAEIQNLGDDKVYLALPDEFTRAWVLTEDAILKTGMSIENNDREKGIYYVLYSDNSKEEGMLSKLKFWGDDDDAKVYQLSLTGVGDKTELVVLDGQGEWAAREEASRILTYIQVQYNLARTR